MFIRILAKKVMGISCPQGRMFNSIITPVISSLQQELQSHVKDIKSYISKDKNSELAKISAEKALQVSLKLHIDDPLKVSNIVFSIAHEFSDNGFTQESITVLQQCLQYIRNTTFPVNSQGLKEKAIICLQYQIGNIYYKLADYHKFNEYLTGVIDSMQFSDPIARANEYYRLARVKCLVYDKSALSLAIEANKMFKNAKPNGIEFIRSLVLLAECYDDCGETSQAETYLREAMNLGIKSSNLLNSTQINECYGLLAKILVKLRKPEEAITIYIKLSNEKEKFPDAAAKFKYLLSTAKKLGEFEFTIPILKELLELLPSISHEPILAISINRRMSLILSRSSKYKEATVFAEEALNILKLHHFESEYVQCCLILAESYLGLEEFDKAKFYIDLCEPKIKNFPHMANILFYHKWVYFFKKKIYKEAENCLRLSLENTVEEKENPDNLYLMYKQLGIVCQYRSGFDEAIQCYEKALAIITRYFGIETTKAANIMENIGKVYLIQKKYKSALELFLQSINIKLKEFGEDSQELISAYHSISDTYYFMDQWNFALNYAEKNISLIKLHQLEKIEELTRGYIITAEVNEKLMNRDKATDAYTIARDLYLKSENADLANRLDLKLKDLRSKTSN